MALGHAIDVSNFSAVPTDAQAAAIRDAGNDLAICGTQNPAITRQQASAFGRAGMATAAYGFLWFDESPEDQVRRALSVGLPFLWLDCEDDETVRKQVGRPGKGASDLSAAATVDFIAKAVAACGDIPCGIYTRRDWWMRQTANATQFKGLPLWDATNDGTPDLGFPAPYGGWLAPMMEQFAFDQVVAGISCDRNVYTKSDAPPLGPNIDVSGFQYRGYDLSSNSFYFTGISVLRHWGGNLGPNMQFVWESFDQATQRDRFGVRVLKTW